MYVLVGTGSHGAKNKLEKAIHAYFTSMDRMTFKDLEAVEAHKDSVKTKLKEMHAEHPRCKEITLSGWSPLNSEDRTLSVYGLIEMRYYSGKDLEADKKVDFADKALEVFTENFMIHSVEELDAAEDADGVPYLTQIEVKYRFFGKIGEAQYVATKLDMGLADAFVSLTMDNELMESLEDQIEEHEDGILVFLNAWVKAYNERLAEDEEG